MPVSEARDWGREFKDLINANFTLDEMEWFGMLSSAAANIERVRFEHDSPYDWAEWDDNDAPL